MIRRSRGSGVSANRASTSAVMSSSVLLRRSPLGCPSGIAFASRLMSNTDYSRSRPPEHRPSMAGQAAYRYARHGKFQEETMAVISVSPEAVRAVLYDGGEMAL